jgi:uncharacterized membrane protein
MWWVVLMVSALFLFTERIIAALGIILDVDDKFFEFAEE